MDIIRHTKHRRFMALALCLIGALGLCLPMAGCSLPMAVVGEVSDPSQTVTDFFDGICEGDYQKADACLSGSSVAMKQMPSDAFSAALMEYLQHSYSYQTVGEMTVENMEAHQEVVFTYLDFDLLSDDLSAKAASLGKRYIKTQDADHTEVKDGVCMLTREGAQKVAAEALAAVMQQPEAYYSTTNFRIRMRYQGGSWKLIMTDELFAAIAGKYNA